MVDLVSGATGREGTLVMSTGVIGQHLQMDKIGQGIAQAVAQAETSHDAWLRVSEAIMTTDTFPKLMSREVTLPGTDRSYRLVGFCKGAGMIKPNMATMLASIFTDANVSAECIQLATKSVVEHSFNAIIVDGDTSTNDTFAVMANGASGMDSITDPHSAEFAEFQAQLRDFATTLSQLIVRDGEGATKFVDVHVKNAPSFADAKAIANTIALSPLVKTAMYGRDANWGRIICAVGFS
ncbi:DmpA/ArgJ-like protein, partial [Caulochytrium protostelioides]